MTRDKKNKKYIESKQEIIKVLLTKNNMKYNFLNNH
jgi:hypothetical protein